MDVFELRQRLVEDDANDRRSFVLIRDVLSGFAVRSIEGSPTPLIVQLNLFFPTAGTIRRPSLTGNLYASRATRTFSGRAYEDPDGEPLRLFRHQREAIQTPAKVALASDRISCSTLTTVMYMACGVSERTPGWRRDRLA